MRYVLNWASVKEDIIKGYKDGMSLRELAEKHNVSHTTICKRLSWWNVSRRGTSHGGRRRFKTSPKPMAPGQEHGSIKIIEKDQMHYPLRWICYCTCGYVHNLTERQIRGEKFRHNS